MVKRNEVIDLLYWLMRKDYVSFEDDFTLHEVADEYIEARGEIQRAARKGEE